MNPCPKACRMGFLRAQSRILHSLQSTSPDGLTPSVASYYGRHLKALTGSCPTIMTPVTESVGNSGRRAALSRERQFVIVSYCFSPLLRGSGAAARLPKLQKPPSKPEHPHVLWLPVVPTPAECPLNLAFCVPFSRCVTLVMQLLAFAKSQFQLHAPVFQVHF